MKKKRHIDKYIYIILYIWDVYYLFIYSFIYLVTRLIETTCLPWCIVRIAPKPPDKGHTKPAECCEIRTKSGEANWDMRVFFSSCAISVCVCMYQTGPYAAALNAENQWKSGRNNSKYIQVPVRETQLQAFQAKSENHTNSAKNSQNVKKCLRKIRKKSHPKELQEFSRWPALSPPPAGPSGEHPLDIFRRSGTLPVTHHPPPGPGHPWSLVEVKFITWESHIPYRFCRKEQRMSSWHVFLRDQSKRILTMDEETPKCFYQASCLSGRRNCLTLPYHALLSVLSCGSGSTLRDSLDSHSSSPNISHWAHPRFTSESDSLSWILSTTCPSKRSWLTCSTQLVLFLT